MPRFTYRSLDKAGLSNAGEIDAVDKKSAIRSLRERGLTPVDLTQSGGEGNSGEVTRSPAKLGKRAALGVHPVARKFFQKLDRLSSGGLPPGDAVKLLATRTGEPALKLLSEEIWRDLSEGRALAESIRRFPEVFEPGEAGLIEAGESTGTLPNSLKRILKLQESREALRKKLTAALAYPALVCGLAGITIALFVFHLLPKLETMMRSLNADFSGAPLVLISIAKATVYGLPAIIVIGLIAFFRMKSLRSTPNGKLKTDALLLQIPLCGKIVSHAEISGVAGLLGTLIASGINSTEALRLAGKPVTNEVIRRRLASASLQINEGSSFSTAFKKNGLMEDADLDIISVNESTGTLHLAFDEIARAHFDDLDAALRRLVNTLSAVFLGTAFVIVFFCLVSVVLSVLQVSRGLLG